MQKATTIKFVDRYEGEAVAIVRAGSNEVGVCLSLMSNGDTHVWMSVPDAQHLAEAILQAIKNAEERG
jgi:hypothetical protein